MLAMVTPKRLGLSTAISTEPDPYLLDWYLYYRDGVNRHGAQLRYDPATGNWDIFDDTPGWQTVLKGYKIQQGSNAWHEVKIVADFENDTYMRLLVGENAVDLTAYGLKLTSSGALGRVEARFKAEGSATAHGPCYLDAVIITQNEPA